MIFLWEKGTATAADAHKQTPSRKQFCLFVINAGLFSVRRSQNCLLLVLLVLLPLCMAYRYLVTTCAD